jgi:hypothetical protein
LSSFGKGGKVLAVVLDGSWASIDGRLWQQQLELKGRFVSGAIHLHSYQVEGSMVSIQRRAVAHEMLREVLRKALRVARD